MRLSAGKQMGKVMFYWCKPERRQGSLRNEKERRSRRQLGQMWSREEGSRRNRIVCGRS